ncbi:MAG: hypothetical protein KF773_19700 [Deltaproteobacteria bacterium]|nr:hypothetical protein [Deltaproteobacteria bacterium]MCW5805902.1 hypothetical protein [Deltaproteobacteria bacterium]
MKGWIASLALALVLALPGCGAGDDTVEGARGLCAFGGELTDCPDADRTPEGACWRLVDCGAIPLSSENNNRFTWGKCMNAIEGATADRQRAVIACIAASTCDELRVGNPPHCLEYFGER